MVERIIAGGFDHLGEIIGVLGIIIAAIFYWKTRRSIGASYYVRTDRLIGPMGPEFPGLEIIYDGRPISSFSSSKIFFWNRGTEAIRREDIAPTAPLTISVRAPERALSYKVLYCSSQHSNIYMEPRDESFLVTFDFLNAGDGCILEILHTGWIGSVSVSGIVIGSGEVVRKEEPSRIKQYVLRGIIAAGFAVAVVTLPSWSDVLPSWSYVLFGLPFSWFDVLSLTVLAFFMTLVNTRLDARWHAGGVIAKKLHDGYARQEQSLSVGRPPYIATVDGEVEIKDIPTYPLALEHFNKLRRDYPEQKVEVFDQQGVVVCFYETRSL